MGLESLFTLRIPPLWTRGSGFGRGCPCPDTLKPSTLQQSPKGPENQAKCGGCRGHSEASSTSLPTPSGGGLLWAAPAYCTSPQEGPQSATSLVRPLNVPTSWQVSIRPRSSSGGCQESPSPLEGWWPRGQAAEVQAAARGTQCCHLVAMGGPQHTPHLSDHPPGSKGWYRIKKILEAISGLAVPASFPSISLGCSEQGRQGLKILISAPQQLWPLSPTDRGEIEALAPLLRSSCRGPPPLLQLGPRAAGPPPLRWDPPPHPAPPMRPLCLKPGLPVGWPGTWGGSSHFPPPSGSPLLPHGLPPNSPARPRGTGHPRPTAGPGKAHGDKWGSGQVRTKLRCSSGGGQVEPSHLASLPGGPRPWGVLAGHRNGRSRS